jgi:hypothetical protein
MFPLNFPDINLMASATTATSVKRLIKFIIHYSSFRR